MCQLNHNRRNIGCHQEAESQGFRLTHGQHLFVVGKLLSLNNVTARAVLCCLGRPSRQGGVSGTTCGVWGARERSVQQRVCLVLAWGQVCVRQGNVR